MNELVSIIIPTFNGSDKISRAIDSALEQTYTSIEIIVVDDNNPDSKDRYNTEQVLSNYTDKGVKYIKHIKNMNGATARNTGLNHAKGEFITFLDDDDFFLKNRIEDSVEVLRNNLQYNAVYCGVVMVQGSEIKDHIKANKIISPRDILLDEMIIGTGSNIFLRKSLVDEVNGFDESFIRHQDLELIIRIADIYPILNLNKTLVVKGTNKTDNVPKYDKYRFAKKLYFNKFNDKIQELDLEEQKNFWDYQYTRLFYAALKSGDLSWINLGRDELEIVRELSRAEKIITFIITYLIHDFKGFNQVIDMIKNYRNRRKINNRIKLEEKVLIEIREFLDK